MSDTDKILRAIENASRESKKDIENLTDIINNKILGIEEDINILKSENKALRESVERLKISHIKLECNNRKQNLIFFGFNDTSEEDNLINFIIKMCNFINTNLKVECKESDIDYVKRIGLDSAKTKPILIKFHSESIKTKIEENRKLLKGTRIFVHKDLPKEIRENKRKKYIESSNQPNRVENRTSEQDTSNQPTPNNPTSSGSKEQETSMDQKQTPYTLRSKNHRQPSIQEMLK